MPELSEHRRRQIEMHRTVADMYRRRGRYPFAAEFQRERNDILVSLAPVGPDRRAFDLGCGTGILLDHLATRCGRVFGVDLSQEMLAGCETRGQGGAVVALVRADMTRLPIAAGMADVIVCRSALHHLDDEVAVLREFCRVLRPDGHLIVGEPANDNPLCRLARWIARRRPSFGKIHTIDRAYTRGQLRALFDRAGLEVRREVRFGFIGYLLCDNPDFVPVLKWLPAAVATGTARFLRALDRLLARIPLVRMLSWYTILDVRRRPAAADRAQ